MRPAKTAIIHFASRIGVSLVGFLATLYFAKELGAEVLGSYFVMIALLTWLTIPATATSTAITKRVSENIQPGEHLSAGFLLNAGVAIVLVLLVLLFDSEIETYIGEPIAQLFALLIVGHVIFWTVINGLKGQKKVAQSGLLEVIDRVTRFGLQVGLVVLGFGLVGLTIGHSAGFLVAAGIGVLLFDGSLQMPGRRHFRRLLDYARYAWLGTIKTRSFAWLDTLVLRFFVGTALIGIYEVAWGLASVLALVSNSLQHTLFPEMSELSVSDDYEQVHVLLNDALVFSGIFIIPGFFGATLLSPEILQLYGDEFVQGQVILVLLIGARGIAAYESTLINTINAIDRPEIAYRINFVFITSNLVLNVGLIYLYGWYGAAIATAASSAVSLLLGYYYISRIIGSPGFPYAELTKQFIAAGLMVLVIGSIDSLRPIAGTFATVAVVFLGACVYAVTLFLLSKHIRRKTLSLVPDSVLVSVRDIPW